MELWGKGRIWGVDSNFAKSGDGERAFPELSSRRKAVVSCCWPVAAMTLICDEKSKTGRAGSPAPTLPAPTVHQEGESLD
jgi:hypothetical protein